MHILKQLFVNNHRWAEKMRAEDPDFFTRLSEQQSPEILWIGCSDSRVPANEIVGMLPGEIFVHRNIANVVVHADLNCLSVIQYAVEVLKVKYIIICGHYGCGGVKTAMEDCDHGLIDHWLKAIKTTYHKNQKAVDALEDDSARHHLMCELNVKQQVENISQNPIIQKAWKSGQKLSVHGWIYSLEDGLLQDLRVSCDGS